jgi:hypothetical protein
MPRNGSGIYSLPSGYLAETGELILADQHNDPLEDIRDDLNAARPVVAGGTGSTTASGARSNLSVYSQTESNAAYVKRVATKTALKALDTASYKSAFLEEAGVQKMFAYTLGNFTTAVAGDPSELIYIPADGILVSIGCWVAVTGTGASIGASLVTPTGATTPGFVADILAREYWVEDFGAVGDGTTDDRAAINTAIATISTAGGGVLRFRAKTYSITRGVDSTIGVILKNNVILRGAGLGTAIKAASGTNVMHLIGNLSADGTLTNGGLMDLTVDGNGQNFSGAGSSGSHGVRIAGVNGFYVRNVAIKNTDQHGLVTLTVGAATDVENRNIFINDIYLENIGTGGWIGGDGLRIFYGAQNCVINNVIGRGIEYHGIHIAYGACQVNNVILYNVGVAAVSAQSDGCIVNNVHVEWESGYVTHDLLVNRPSAGTFGRIFIDSGTGTAYRDNGVAWKVAAANLTGVWAVTRGGFPTGGKSSYSNIKIVFRVTDNVTWNPTYNDGFRVEVPYVTATNIQVYGKFRFGLYTTDNDGTYSGVIVDGARQDGIRLGGDRNSLSDWRVVTASIASTGTYAAVNLYGSYTKVSGGYALDATNVATAIIEQSGEDYNQVYGNHLEGSGAKLSLSGLNTRSYENTGLSYRINDLTAVNSPDDTATNVLKTYTITSGEFRSGSSIEVECFGNVTGTGGTKVIRAFVGTNYFTIADEAAGDTQDWGFRMRIRRFSGTGYSVEVFGGEEAGTAAVQYGRYSISGNFAVGVDATLGSGSDNVGVTGFFIRSV